MNSIAGEYSVKFTRASLLMESEECMTAINVSRKDRLTLSISVAVGSTIVSWSAVIESTRARVLTTRQNISANCPLRNSVSPMLG